ncbi:efflux RND transporter periplasmic adaptor subunit [Brumicola nitratireducens]|uniref:HlyD family secretion protein n=1 Tax=Glaciecola nitratireducens (strain JCM 12485 / KCTC 12276 / FR1064) TaxID=1085623 RepID=G4QMH2_GLANF|nr:efflux RND transporter periplasmic adaptor subunit [Glaciecola nitratireducens]AEP30924.1 HlyD family secretion protein [Glaciecola nitratireducens FR1064]
MPKFVKFSPLLIGVAALIGFAIYINLPVEIDAGNQRDGGGITSVVSAKAETQAFPIIVEALGTAVANESVNITAQQAETVRAVLFEDGGLVKKGQLLIELNDREEKARVHELAINIAEAKRQLTRIKGLAKQSAASEQLLDEQKARVDSLEAQKDVVDAQLSELQVRAPFAGRLGIRQVSIGSLVRPGDIISTLDDLSIMKVDFSISESHLASVANGQSVVANSIAYPGENFNGSITSIGSRIDPVTRAIQVRAQITNDDLKLRPGMLLQINLEKRVVDALVIPESALIPEGESQFVFVIDEENKARKTKVTIGQRKPGWIQILDGLDAGQEVIIEGTLKVRDGGGVKVVPANAVASKV